MLGTAQTQTQLSARAEIDADIDLTVHLRQLVPSDSVAVEIDVLYILAHHGDRLHKNCWLNIERLIEIGRQKSSGTE